MIASRSAWTIPTCLMLAACGRGDRPSAGMPGSGAPPAASSESAPPAAPASPATIARLPLRDPVALTATADASIYEAPASMWSARFTDEAGKFTYLNLTLWRLTAAPAVQVSLGLTGAGETSEIATVKGSQVRGSGSGRIEPKGEGGALIVDGRDENGRAVHLTVDRSRFTEPVAEGG